MRTNRPFTSNENEHSINFKNRYNYRKYNPEQRRLQNELSTVYKQNEQKENKIKAFNARIKTLQKKQKGGQKVEKYRNDKTEYNKERSSSLGEKIDKVTENQNKNLSFLPQITLPKKADLQSAQQVQRLQLRKNSDYQRGYYRRPTVLTNNFIHGSKQNANCQFIDNGMAKQKRKLAQIANQQSGQENNIQEYQDQYSVEITQNARNIQSELFNQPDDTEQISQSICVNCNNQIPIALIQKYEQHISNLQQQNQAVTEELRIKKEQLITAKAQLQQLQQSQAQKIAFGQNKNSPKRQNLRLENQSINLSFHQEKQQIELPFEVAVTQTQQKFKEIIQQLRFQLNQENIQLQESLKEQIQKLSENEQEMKDEQKKIEESHLKILSEKNKEINDLQVKLYEQYNMIQPLIQHPFISGSNMQNLLEELNYQWKEIFDTSEIVRNKINHYSQQSSPNNINYDERINEIVLLQRGTIDAIAKIERMEEFVQKQSNDETIKPQIEQVYKILHYYKRILKHYSIVLQNLFEDFLLIIQQNTQMKEEKQALQEEVHGQFNKVKQLMNEGEKIIDQLKGYFENSWQTKDLLIKQILPSKNADCQSLGHQEKPVSIIYYQLQKQIINILKHTHFNVNEQNFSEIKTLMEQKIIAENSIRQCKIGSPLLTLLQVTIDSLKEFANEVKKVEFCSYFQLLFILELTNGIKEEIEKN